MGRVMRDDSGTDVPLAQRLRETVGQLVGAYGAPLGPVVPAE